jgi:hypothetical protein
MALPISGPISANDINVELLLNPTATMSLNDSAARELFAQLTGEISYDHGHGKSSTVYITYMPPGGFAAGVNLRQIAIDAGWNQNAYVEVTISPSTVIYSTSTSIPSLTIDGPFPHGVKLINTGTILGRGGTGGDGGYGDGGVAGTVGGTGGTGVDISTPVIIENNGTIGGGGGGGGGGGSGLNVAYGGGGGGGAAYGGGGNIGNAGASGALFTGGGGGGIIDLGTKKRAHPSGAGGTGGNPGVVGGGGNPGAGGETPGGGGTPGVAINGNSYVTWITVGTTYGNLN